MIECLLGDGFRYVLFSSLLGEDSHFDEYFSKGLEPPTSLVDKFIPYEYLECAIETSRFQQESTFRGRFPETVEKSSLPRNTRWANWIQLYMG